MPVIAARLDPSTHALVWGDMKGPKQAGEPVCRERPAAAPTLSVLSPLAFLDLDQLPHQLGTSEVSVRVRGIAGILGRQQLLENRANVREQSDPDRLVELLCLIPGKL